MSSVALIIASCLINAAWQITFLGATGWIVSYLLRRLGPQFQHRIWLICLGLTLLVPLSPFLTACLFHIEPLKVTKAHGTVVLHASNHAAPFLSIVNITLPNFLIRLLVGLYLALVFWFALRLWRMLQSTNELIRNAVPASLAPERKQTWEFVTKSFKIKNAAFLCSRDVSVPITAGFWRPALLVPVQFAEMTSPEEFFAAVGHECAHIQRHDFQKNLLYEVLLLFTCFHPITWLIKSHISKTREMICDRAVTEKLVDSRTYALSLIQLASKVPFTASPLQPHGIGIFDNNTLEERIMMLKAPRQQVSLTWKYCLAISGTATILLIASISGALTQSVAAQTSVAQPSTASKNHKYRPDLSCTFYDPKGIGHEGTCGIDEDTNTYRCFSNEDRTLNNMQIACESKVRRARVRGLKSRTTLSSGQAHSGG